MFDSGSTEARQIFSNNWRIESRVIVQTTSEENFISLEKNDSGSSSVYIGDEKPQQKRIEFNDGIYFSSADFIEITKIMTIISSTSGSLEKIITRRNAKKIKRLYRLGIHLKNQYRNDFYH